MNKNTNLNLTNTLAVQKNNLKNENSIKLTPTIATKYSNKGSVLIALNSTSVTNPVGRRQEFISFSKEWKYSVYFYNNNISKNLSSDSINLHKLITKYFYIYLHYLASSEKYRSYKVIRRSLNKIHVARPEIKYTNSKIIFTLYTYNREKLALLRNKQGKKIVGLIKKLASTINTKYKTLNLLALNNNIELNTTRLLKFVFRNQLILIKSYKSKLNFNKYKFETRFLVKLANFIKKFPLYNRIIVFNIVNLKSISSHTDLFSRLAILKSKKRYAKIYRTIFYILNTGRVPKLNKIQDKTRRNKSVDLDLIENKYNHFNLNSIIAKTLDLEKNFIHIRNNYSSIKELSKIIFDSINYKILGGIKLSIKGRLTKRYRADRAIHRLQWKGGLRNLDSSYRGLSVLRKRGFLNLGVESSFFSSKRKIGAFAVKGWTNSK